MKVQLTPSLGNSGFQKRQDFDRTCICYVADCMLSILESLEPNDALLNTWNTRNSPFFCVLCYSCQNTAFVMNLTVNAAPDGGLFMRSFSESYSTFATRVIFCACLLSFNQDKLKLPPSSGDVFDGYGCLLKYRRSHLACSILG